MKIYLTISITTTIIFFIIYYLYFIKEDTSESIQKIKPLIKNDKREKIKIEIDTEIETLKEADVFDMTISLSNLLLNKAENNIKNMATKSKKYLSINKIKPLYN